MSSKKQRTTFSSWQGSRHVFTCLLGLFLALLCLEPVSTAWADGNTQKKDAEITITKKHLQAILREYLRANEQRLPQAEIRFTSLRTPPPFTLPDANLGWQVRPSSSDILGSSSFSILFTHNGKLIKNISIHCRMEAIAPVLVAARTLRRGRLIQAEDLRLENKDISKINEPFTREDIAEVVGMLTRRTISTGRVIEPRYLTIPPVITSGELVKIWVRSEAMKISTQGIAKTAGRIGDRIKVINTSSKKTIYCRVLGPGQVEVEL